VLLKLLPLVLAVCSCTPVETARRQAIVGGASDAAHPAVVALVQKSNSTLCSGTLVAPATVLTAAHCVYQVAPADLEVRVGADDSSPDQTISVAAVAVYPGFSGTDDDRLGGLDLAAVTLAANAAIAPLVVDTSGTSFAVGDAVTLVGYGASDGPTSAGAGIRRSVDLPVTTICPRFLRAGSDLTNACVGDSGGAVLEGGALVAVIAFGVQGCGGPSSFTRLDPVHDWVAAVLAGNASAPCPSCPGPDPSCSPADAGPDGGAPSGGAGCSIGAGDPPSWSVLALVLWLLWWRRREAVTSSRRETRRRY
jgi:secreted trypsin-like serine protease